jgi:hypothetical protein
LNLLKNQLTEISARRQISETELSTTDNVALRNRLETVLLKLINDQMDKEREVCLIIKLFDGIRCKSEGVSMTKYYNFSFLCPDSRS